MTAEERSAQDKKLVDKAVADLSEHFDYVQVFAASYRPAEDEGTVTYSLGRGDWYGRLGFVKNWVMKEEEWERCRVRKRFEDTGDDDDE